MNRDYFIIAVYCLVCDHYQAITTQFAMRRGGFAPELTAAEAITIELADKHFKLAALPTSLLTFAAIPSTAFPVCVIALALYAMRRSCGRSKPSSHSGLCR